MFSCVKDNQSLCEDLRCGVFENSIQFNELSVRLEASIFRRRIALSSPEYYVHDAYNNSGTIPFPRMTIPFVLK